VRRPDDPLSRAQHRKIGGDLFNYTWSLLDRKRRTPEEEEEMIHAAHASRYHWGHAGTALEWSIGEWLLSRVYATVGRAEPALHHARRALAIAERSRLPAFYLAYAYEAIARAGAAEGNRQRQRLYAGKARRLAPRIRDRDDRRMLLEDLAALG
jgi:hypothetical protein